MRTNLVPAGTKRGGAGDYLTWAGAGKRPVSAYRPESPPRTDHSPQQRTVVQATLPSSLNQSAVTSRYLCQVDGSPASCHYDGSDLRLWLRRARQAPTATSLSGPYAG